jgi:CRP/FNR family transcriptional regulator, cyclic AMP receptor protein
MSQGIPELYKRVDPKVAPRRPEQPPRRTKRQTAAALSGVPLFAGFSSKHLNKLAEKTDQLSFQPGQSIVVEGDPGEALYVILSGQAKVTRGGKRVAMLLPGDFFGEMSAIDGGPRTASVVAQTPMEVLRLFRHTLARLIEDEPQVGLKLLDGIVRRIREVERANQR